MQGLSKSKRVIILILIAFVLAASAAAVVVFKPKDSADGLLPPGDSVSLSALGSVSEKNVGIFSELNITQNDIRSLTLSGKVDPEEYAKVVGGYISVRIGQDKIYSAIRNITVNSDHTFVLEFTLNYVFCREFGNEIPLVINYAYEDNSVISAFEYSAVVGVVTYDYNSAILSYPDGAEYVSDGNILKKLSTSYIPDDCAADENGNVTVVYDGNKLTFKANPAKVENEPEVAGSDPVFDKNGSSVIINSVPGLEYGVIEIKGSINENYGTEFIWTEAVSEQTVLKGLTPDTYYTLWVRTPAGEGTLASAPVYLGKIKLLTQTESDAKQAFLDKYEEIKDKLYSEENKIVTADPQDTEELLRLYYALDEETKSLTTISEKSKYIVISNYLANHKEIVYKSAADVTAEDDILLNQAVSDFDLLDDSTAKEFASVRADLMSKKTGLAISRIESMEYYDQLEFVLNEEELALFNGYLDAIRNAENCAVVDENFENALNLATSKFITGIYDLLDEAYSKYFSALSAVIGENDNRLGGLKTIRDDTYNKIKLLFEGDPDNGVLPSEKPYTEGNALVKRASAEMLRYCAGIELDSYAERIPTEGVDSEDVAAVIAAAKEKIRNLSSELEVGKVTLSVKLELEKLSVLAGIDDTDTAKAQKTEAVEYVYDKYISKLSSASEDDLSYIYTIDTKAEMAEAAEKYEFYLFLKKYDSLIDKEVSEVTIEDADLIEAAWEELSQIPDSEDKALVSEKLDRLRRAAYTNWLNSQKTDGEDAEKDAFIDSAVSAIESAADPKQIYDTARSYLGVYDKNKELSDLLEDFRDGTEETDALVDLYLERLNGIVFDPSGDITDIVAYGQALIAEKELVYKKAKAEFDFLAKKAEISDIISAMKDSNPAVISAVERYLKNLKDIIFVYENVGDDVDAYYASKVSELDAVAEKAKDETDFEKLRKQIKDELASDISDRKSSGKYSESQIAVLDSKLASAIAAIDNINYGSGAVKADLEAQKAAFVTDFESVKITSVSNGSLPNSGDFASVDYPSGYNTANGLWGNVMNSNGMNSTLALSMKFIDGDRKISGDNIIIVTGDMSDADAKKAVDAKNVLFSVDISLADSLNKLFTGENNGEYTVRILLPEEYRGVSGLQVISEENGNTYVYETSADGNYLVFKTTHFSEYLVIGDKTVNLLWLVIVLAVLLLAEAVIVVWFTVKKRKGMNAASVAPILAIIFTPEGIIPATIVLGVFVIAGGVAAGVTVAKSRKSGETPNAEQESQEMQPDAGKTVGEVPETVVSNETEDKKISESEKTEEADASDNEAEVDAAETDGENVSEDINESAEIDEQELTENAPEESFAPVDEEEIPEKSEVKLLEETVSEEAEASEEETFSGEETDKSTDEEKPETVAENTEEPLIVDVEAEPETDEAGEEDSEGLEEAPEDYNSFSENTDNGDRASESEEDGNRPPPIMILPVDGGADTDSDDEPEEISDEDDTPDEQIILPDDTDEDTAEDKKVFSADDGNKIYVTYDYSFESKLILSSEEVQSRYSVISDMLLSYGLKKRESWKKERYFLKGKSYANIIFRGKTLCVCLAINPKSLEGTKYFYEDVGSVKKYEGVPVMVRVRSGRGCKYALELISMMLEEAGIVQKRAVGEEFELRPSENKEQLIERGLIKVMMTDGNGEIVAADFEAMKNQKFNLSAGMPILKRVTVEEAAAVPDDEVTKFIETEDETEDLSYGRRRGIINIDTISEAYNDGDTVTLKDLIDKHLVPKNINFIKVLARGALDKSLTVKAHDFSMDAAKMIVIAGGSVVKLKS